MAEKAQNSTKHVVELPEDVHSRMKSIAASRRIALREASKEAADDWLKKHAPVTQSA